jgi:hypothetical protein
MIMKLPGQEAKGTTISEMVQPIDITPTILDLAGIDTTAKLPGKAPLPFREIAQELKGVMLGREKGLNPLDGKSLIPLIRNEKSWDREYIFSSQRLGRLNANFSFSLTPEADSTMFWITVTGKKHVLLIGGREEEAPQLFDLENDPGQEKDIYNGNKELAAQMATALTDCLSEKGGSPEDIDLIKAKIKAFA